MFVVYEQEIAKQEGLFQRHVYYGVGDRKCIQLLITSGQRILTKGRIADWSPLAAAKGFVQS